MDDLKSSAGKPIPYSDPDARRDRASTREDKAVTIDLLENDEGATGIWKIKGRLVDFGDTVKLASGARVTVGEGGKVVYDPSDSKKFDALDSGEFGFDSFRYTAFDNEFGSDMATVRVRIKGVNDAPVAHDDSVHLLYDDPIFTTLAIGEEGDPDPLPPEVTTLAIGEEGDPDPLPPDVTTMMVGEEGDPDPLLTTKMIGEEGDPDSLPKKVRISPFANDKDADGDDLAIAEIDGKAVSAGESVRLKSGAIVRVSKDGDTLIYKRGNLDEFLQSNDADLTIHRNSRIALDSFTYRASDGDALSNSAEVTLTRFPYYDELA